MATRVKLPDYVDRMAEVFADRHEPDVTPAKEERAMAGFAVKTETERALLSALSPAARRRMNDDLRTVLVALEGPA